MTPEMALGFADKAGFGLAGPSTDVTLGGNVSTPFGGLDTDPGSTPGFTGSTNTGQLGALGSSFDSTTTKDTTTTDTTKDSTTTTDTTKDSTTNDNTTKDSTGGSTAGDTSGGVSEGPSTGDMGDAGGGGNGGGGGTDPVVTTPTVTTDPVITTPTVTTDPVITTPTTKTVSPVKMDVSKFLGNLGKPTYVAPTTVYTPYTRPNVPQYKPPVFQQGIGQFYKPYFPLLPYQRKYP